MKRLCWSICVLFVFAGYVAGQKKVINEAGKKRIGIHEGWRFHQVNKTDWHSATVPGCVHTDLLNNKLIEDPFYRDNEQKLQWIGKTDWEYQTTFNVAPELLKRQHLELVFEGLDTYADVYLNDTLLLKADNMFRTWRIESKQNLKAGANTLRIVFRSPINEILPVMAKMNYQLPAGNDQGEKTSPHTRKAPYQYGWDWGPRFVTSGIWKPVFLETWDDARINDLHIKTREINKQAAQMTAAVEIVAETDGEATIILDNLNSKTVATQKRVTLTKGVNQINLDFVVQRPELWYPNGLGAQPLYSFRARLSQGAKTLDQHTIRTGIRSLVLRREPDEWGQSFAFVINGIPVFAKGGNWIPADSFPTRITKEKYRYMIESVRDSNMNMLRVWGGGIYESDYFYELCDEMGILVWQDFMFGCSMYPGDQPFLDNVRAEAIDNVKRLRNYPSIVIWAGNNEVETAWRNWGWKKTLPASLWDDYEKLFHGVLAEVTKEYDPSRPYWSSSPRGGLDDDPDSLKSGDMHFWQVWHASAPFSNYEEQFPRFMSEYGFQSFPMLETVNTYALPSDHNIESPVMLAHQRHPRGNQLVREYMLRDYAEPKDFESFLYVSQVLQAEGIKIGAEHLRRIMPRNMGSLYWQINDCWPVASWSSIDYTGRWKALQYYSKRFYNDLLISPRTTNGNVDFYVVSDKTKPTPAQISVKLLDFSGQTLNSTTKDVEIKELASKSYLTLPVKDWIAGRDDKQVYIYCELLVGGKPVSENYVFFQPYKTLSLPTPQYSVDVTRSPKGLKLSVSSKTFARAVYISSPQYAGFFSDNFFHLVLGKKVELEFRTSNPPTIEEFRKQLKIRSMFDAF